MLGRLLDWIMGRGYDDRELGRVIVNKYCVKVAKPKTSGGLGTPKVSGGLGYPKTSGGLGYPRQWGGLEEL